MAWYGVRSPFRFTKGSVFGLVEWVLADTMVSQGLSRPHCGVLMCCAICSISLLWLESSEREGGGNGYGPTASFRTRSCPPFLVVGKCVGAEVTKVSNAVTEAVMCNLKGGPVSKLGGHALYDFVDAFLTGPLPNRTGRYTAFSDRGETIVDMDIFDLTSIGKDSAHDQPRVVYVCRIRAVLVIILTSSTALPLMSERGL